MDFASPSSLFSLLLPLPFCLYFLCASHYTQGLLRAMNMLYFCLHLQYRNERWFLKYNSNAKIKWTILCMWSKLNYNKTVHRIKNGFLIMSEAKRTLIPFLWRAHQDSIIRCYLVACKVVVLNMYAKIMIVQ